MLAGVTYGQQDSKQVTNEFWGLYEKPEPPKDKPPSTPDDPGSDIPGDNVPGGGVDDPGSDIPDDNIPGGGRDDPNPPESTPKTGDDANPRLWLIMLAISTFVLRHELFFRKNRCKQ
jgi:hypothetical protein